MDISSLLDGNEFLSGGVVLLVLGAILAYMREIPGKIWVLLKRQLTVHVEIRNREAIKWIENFLEDSPYGEKCRLLHVSLFHKDNGDLVPVMGPGMGTHLFRHDGKWYLLRRYLDSGGDSNADSIADILKQDVVTITTLGRDKVNINSLIIQSRDHYVEKSRGSRAQKVYANIWGNEWTYMVNGHTRPLESVILADGQMEYLVSSITNFLHSEDWYKERGIPYKFGILLYGPPGTGKSSIVKGIASHFEVRLHMLDLTRPSLTDMHLVKLMADLPENSLVFVEDIDCDSASSRKKDKKSDNNEVTLKGLLNAVDGVTSPHGAIIVYTTNDIESLDPALIRPGRVDVKLHIKNATDSQAEKLFLKFFPHHPELALDFASDAGGERNSMASLQGHLMLHRSDPSSAALWEK